MTNNGPLAKTAFRTFYERIKLASHSMTVSMLFLGHLIDKESDLSYILALFDAILS